MNKNFRSGLLMLAAGALAVSCADYNDLGGFTAEPDPSFVEPYKDLSPVKSYIDSEKYPNMSLGATLKVSEFNKQEREHAVAMTNFNSVTFGSDLMGGKIVNEKGVMNFLDMMDLLEHAEEINANIYGSPIVANTNQPDAWFSRLTAPIEIPVDFVEGKTVDYNEMEVGPFTGSVPKGNASIVNYDNQVVLKINSGAHVHIIEGFEVDPLAKYTATFWARPEKDQEITIEFSGTKVNGNVAAGKWAVKAGKWNKIVVEAQSAEGVTDGYLKIENARTSPLYIQKVQIGYFPDNHRPQTAEEISDTINYALNTWCDAFMKYNEGRIKVFDLIDEPIDSKAELENGKLDLKHSTDDKVFWQDILGSENYAPIVSKVASEAYEKYEGDPAQLKFFIAESGLEDSKKLESLVYWMNIWTAKGAKIDGINAKLNLCYSENADVQAANEATVLTLLENLAATGKLIRLSNFDIKYADAEGASVTTAAITATQRQKLADYYAFVIKSYMNKIPNAQQAGICKTNMVDATDPVGLWTIVTVDKKSDWVRNVTYKAVCDALSGK